MAFKTIALEGQTVTYGGRLLHLEWGYKLEQQIKAAGGEPYHQISDKLTLFIDGHRAGSKKIKAMTRGAIILSEEQFLELLEQGSLEIETRPGVERDLDLNAVMGEVRSLLEAAAQNASWTALASLLDRCDEDHLPALVHYIEPHLETWGRRKRWHTSEKNPLFTYFYPKYWITGIPQAHMCVAPPGWLLEALREEPSARHKLARALNLEGMQLNSGLAKRILGHSCWNEILALNLGVQNKYAPGFFTWLIEQPIAQQLEELWVDHDPVGLFGKREVDTSLFPNLKLLKCRAPMVRYRPDTGPEAFERIREQSGWIGPDVRIMELKY